MPPRPQRLAMGTVASKALFMSLSSPRGRATEARGVGREDSSSPGNSSSSSSSADRAPTSPTSCLHLPPITPKSAKSRRRPTIRRASMTSATMPCVTTVKTDRFQITHTEPRRNTIDCSSMRRADATHDGNASSSSGGWQVLPQQTATLELRSKCVGRWKELRLNFAINCAGGGPADDFLGLYVASEHRENDEYEASLLTRGHAQGSRCFISPNIPGTYEVRLVRNDSWVLASETFQVE